MNYERVALSFEQSTGEDLWKTVEKHSLSNGFFFETFEDFEEFLKSDTENATKLITSLTKLLTKSVNKITDKRMIFALAVSLYNTRFDTPRMKIETTYVSKLYVTQSEAAQILSYYGKSMSNPIAFAIDTDNSHHSLLFGKALDQVNIYSSNGRTSRRVVGAFKDYVQYNQMDIDYVHIDMYHPTVWYILKEKKLGEYQHLFSNAKTLCEKWILNSIQKLEKTNEASNSFSTMEENITQ